MDGVHEWNAWDISSLSNCAVSVGGAGLGHFDGDESGSKDFHVDGSLGQILRAVEGHSHFVRASLLDGVWLEVVRFEGTDGGGSAASAEGWAISESGGSALEADLASGITFFHSRTHRNSFHAVGALGLLYLTGPRMVGTLYVRESLQGVLALHCTAGLTSMVAKSMI